MMKKFLLGGTAALVAIFVSTTAMSQDASSGGQTGGAQQGTSSTGAKLTISASTTFHMSFFSQDAHTSGGNTDGTAFGSGSFTPGSGQPTVNYVYGKGQGYNFSQDDSNLDFSFQGKTDQGVEYLARINFTGATGSGVSENNYSVRNRVRQNYVQLRMMGVTMQGGNVWGTETTSISDGSAVMHGDGGFGSNWSSRFNEPYNAFGSTGNMVYGAYLAGTSSTGTKLNIQTPRVFGLQLGASLTPNTGHSGDMYHNNNQHPAGKSPNFGAGNNFLTPYIDQNHQAYSASYNTNFGSFNIAMSGALVTSSQTKNAAMLRNNTNTGVTDNGKTYEPTRGYNLGATFSVWGYDIGVGYYDNKKTGVTKVAARQGRDAGKVWNVALGWSSGPYAFAIGYLNGKRNNGRYVAGSNDYGGGTAKADIYSLTADWRLADGLTVYGDLNYAKMTDGSRAVDGSIADNGAVAAQRKTNKGTVFLLGTRVNF